MVRGGWGFYFGEGIGVGVRVLCMGRGLCVFNLLPAPKERAAWAYLAACRAEG